MLIRLTKIIEDRYYSMISDGDCNHAIHISNLGTFAYELITNDNLLFKPTFKLKKKEKKTCLLLLENYKIKA